MKDGLLKFTLVDFLAYMFPGMVALLAIGVIIKLSPLHYTLNYIQASFLSSIGLLAMSYLLGVVLSSLISGYEDVLYRWLNLPSPVEQIPLEVFGSQVKQSFTDVFGFQMEWNVSHFYVARSLIQDKMPSCVIYADRQNALRQARRNSIIPILLSSLAGVFASARIFWMNGIGVAAKICVLTFVVAGIITVTYMVLKNVVVNGMYKNRLREVREIYSALLVFSILSRKNMGIVRT